MKTAIDATAALRPGFSQEHKYKEHSVPIRQVLYFDKVQQFVSIDCKGMRAWSCKLGKAPQTEQ